MTFHFQFLMPMQLEFFDGNIQIRSTKIHRDIDDKFPAPVQSVDLEQKKKQQKISNHMCRIRMEKQFGKFFSARSRRFFNKSHPASNITFNIQQ